MTAPVVADTLDLETAFQLASPRKYAAIYDKTLQSDYEAAMARLQARSETDPDWDLWGPTVEAAFQTEAATTGDPEPDVVTN